MSPDKTMDDVSKIPITYGNDVRLTKVMVEMVRADCDHFDALTPLSDDQIDKLRGRISAAKSVNLS